MLNFIFFGRFEREKGFDLVREAARHWKNQGLPFCLFLFGQGSVEPFFTQDCRTLSNEEVLNVKSQEGEVFYFGHRDSSLIRAFMEKHVDYALMPSRFLETFGLSALEAWTAGVPVLAPKKGGLRAFDPIEVDLLEAPSLPKPSEELRARLKEQAQSFSGEKWLQILKTILPKGAKKILLVTDFLETIGGTEQHVKGVAELLKSEGYAVRIFGRKNALRPRILGLFYALWNPLYVVRLRRELRIFQPEVIWCHSILRFLGPSVLRLVGRSSAFKLITIHDLGLFVQYPSRVEEEGEIPKESSWKNFYGFGLVKYFALIRPILKELRGFDLILVPSDFMQKLLTGVKTKVFPHFIK